MPVRELYDSHSIDTKSDETILADFPDQVILVYAIGGPENRASDHQRIGHHISLNQVKFPQRFLIEAIDSLLQPAINLLVTRYRGCGRAQEPQDSHCPQDKTSKNPQGSDIITCQKTAQE